ncbi:MAG: 2,3-diaminopropionate biosynthesis protein SbnB [Rubrivivax sp.]|nr:2,3-diaminopropionate biosynthesis protein SbnB [Rubrivivax sp.]
MPIDTSLLVLSGPDVHELLQGREADVIGAVRSAYLEHQKGHSCLPHSVFVRFPERVKERIIALPAYLGGERELAGIKWISSFPGNHDLGISRASAIMVLNSLQTGRPEVVLEGSLISAARTAASAALAADVLHAPGPIGTLGVVGCGLINREIVRFVSSLGRSINRILAYDIDRRNAERFGVALADFTGSVQVEISATLHEVLAQSQVVSFATTAVEPTVTDISMCQRGATILHISLRDLVADVVLSTDNIVDDVDHAVRAQTSLHLAEQKVGHRDFVRGTLAEVLNGGKPARRGADDIVVFSPFGLGVLDLAVAQLVQDGAVTRQRGSRVERFFEGV